MPRNSTSGLADWKVCLKTPGAFPLTVRASSMRRQEGSYILDDAMGNALFMAPQDAVLYIRRSEPREDRPRSIDPALVDAVADEVERRQRERAAK